MKVTMRVREVDTHKIPDKLSKANRRAAWAVTEQARMDTRPYVPRLSGDLVGTADTESQPERGLLVWGSFAVPYAQKQYYTFPNKTKQFHPLATMRWFEVSKGVNGKKWEATAKREYRKGMKG
jgi:hypothetical protein